MVALICKKKLSTYYKLYSARLILRVRLKNIQTTITKIVGDKKIINQV